MTFPMIEISSLHNLIETIDNIKKEEEDSGNSSDFLFRGQQKDWDLLPKLARLKLKGEITNIERLILEEFERTSLPLSEFMPKDKWDVVSLAQHHGLPTRLLDWSYSALVALWFVVGGSTPPSSKDNFGILWLLKTTPSDFRTSDDSLFANKNTKIFRPNVISRRISAQSGVFTAHKIILNGSSTKSGKIVRFDTHKEFKNKLVKLKIPHEIFPILRCRLNLLGINSSTIFPDIDGLCSHLQWRFSYYDDE